jgi:hypothetical protein
MTHALTLWLAADPPPAAANPGWLAWLTPPIATVCAAFIAVIGALIAYAGVTKTTRTTRRENRRAEKVAVLTEAFAAVHGLSRAIERVNKPTDPAERAERVKAMEAGPMGELGDKYSIAATKLSLYGFDTAAKTSNTLNIALLAMWDRLCSNPATVVNEDESTEAYKAALAALHQAVADLA